MIQPQPGPQLSSGPPPPSMDGARKAVQQPVALRLREIWRDSYDENMADISEEWLTHASRDELINKVLGLMNLVLDMEKDFDRTAVERQHLLAHIKTLTAASSQRSTPPPYEKVFEKQSTDAEFEGALDALEDISVIEPVSDIEMSMASEPAYSTPKDTPVEGAAKPRRKGRPRANTNRDIPEHILQMMDEQGLVPGLEEDNRQRAQTMDLNSMRRSSKEIVSHSLEQQVEKAVLQKLSRKYSDPRVHQAVVRIQRCYRNHRLRKQFRDAKKEALRRSVQRRMSREDALSPAGAKARSTRRLSLSIDNGPLVPPLTSMANVVDATLAQSAITEVSESEETDTSSADKSWKAPAVTPLNPSENERVKRIGVYHFNRHANKGVDWLIEHNILPDNAKAVAQFLHIEPGLCRSMIGEYLGHVTSNFNVQVLEEYVEEFNLRGMEFDRALRYFLGSFRLPGEAQKIEKILEVFAAKFHEHNPDVFLNADTPFILSFSVVMLNTDAHNQANKHKMTKEEFIRNNRGIDDGGNLPTEFLSEIFDRIQRDEFATMPDNLTIIERITNQISGKLENVSVPWRQFVRESDVVEIKDESQKREKGKHTRRLFLFNDILLVTKRSKTATGKKCVLSQSINLVDVILRRFVSNTFVHAFELVLTEEGRTVFRFNIEDRNAQLFENSLREMIVQCQEIENGRLKASAKKFSQEKKKSMGLHPGDNGLRKTPSAISVGSTCSRASDDSTSGHNSSKLRRRLSLIPGRLRKNRGNNGKSSKSQRSSGNDSLRASDSQISMASTRSGSPSAGRRDRLQSVGDAMHRGSGDRKESRERPPRHRTQSHSQNPRRTTPKQGIPLGAPLSVSNESLNSTEA